MRMRTLLLLLFGGLIAAFVALNWSAFVTPTALSVGVATFEAPIGLAMLGLLIAVAAVFAIYAAFWQGSVLLDTRRHVKEMQLQRQLADQAEASRFTELRGVMHSELAQMGERLAASQELLRTEMRDGTNSLAAMFGELDDRLAVRGADPIDPDNKLVRP